MGIHWEYIENTLGIHWEYIGNTLGIHWEYIGNNPLAMFQMQLGVHHFHCICVACLVWSDYSWLKVNPVLEMTQMLLWKCFWQIHFLGLLH